MQHYSQSIQIYAPELEAFSEDDKLFKKVMQQYPENRRFSSYREYSANRKSRIAFCKTLATFANVSGNFRVSEYFVNNFIERND
jgi:hypothetical protein